MLLRGASKRTGGLMWRLRAAVTLHSVSVKQAAASGAQARSVRVRFAPSPTGDMHVGGLRTALYNWLFARRYGGQFVVRIEDTDRSRLVAGAQQRILETLSWAGLVPDEGPPPIGGPRGPYVQSERLPVYKEFTQKLIDRGSAYICFCSERRLDLLRKEAHRRRQKPRYDNRCRHLSKAEQMSLLAQDTPHVVRFKLKDGPLSFQDIVFGETTVDLSANEGDFIILKSDGFPTYHLANVVDDYLMGISHVLRGVEWQVSTPKHLQMFMALGLSDVAPRYAHLPLLTNDDGKKLSKRNKDFLCEHLLDKYLPEAVVNFLLLSSGGFGKTTGEFYSIEDFIKNLELSSLSTHSCKLNLPRLTHINRLAIRSLGPSLRQRAYKFVKRQYPNVDEEYFFKAFDYNKERLSTLDDLISTNLAFLWSDLPAECIVPDKWSEFTF